MKKGMKIHSFKVKKQAIADLEAEIETKESLQIKYGISKSSVNNWIKQVRHGKDATKNRAAIPEADRRKAVREVLSGLLTIEAARVKYGVRTRTTIREWIRRYSNDLPVTIPSNTMKEEDPLENGVKHRCKELEEALSKAQLQIAGLETMIDIAEKELRINIRKKSGTKQSL